jgi:hypothetical protein
MVVDLNLADAGVARKKYDCVYFLMFPGWKDELQANRWHYAVRWARKLPVALLQPDQLEPDLKGISEDESRIPNSRILHIKSSTSEGGYIKDSLVQLTQVLWDMKQHGWRRPLLWCYNPYLAGLYVLTPAAGRVYHATENYFQFPNAGEFFQSLLLTALRASDNVIAVSKGVASSISEALPTTAPTVVTNGCDYAAYRAGRPDREIVALRRKEEKLAVFAGNINRRLDFRLLNLAQERVRDTMFLMIGPLRDVSAADKREWTRFFSGAKVKYMEAVEPARLPHIYAACDVGIIPYKSDPLLIKNGFPLKALEMCATGLPVVSTFMEPLVGLAKALHVTRSHDEFLDQLQSASRHDLSDEENAELLRVSETNDYDRKFNDVLRILCSCPSASPSIDFSPFIGGDLASLWSRALRRDTPTTSCRDTPTVSQSLSFLARSVPRSIRYRLRLFARRRV